MTYRLSPENAYEAESNVCGNEEKYTASLHRDVCMTGKIYAPSELPPEFAGTPVNLCDVSEVWLSDTVNGFRIAPTHEHDYEKWVANQFRLTFFSRNEELKVFRNLWVIPSRWVVEENEKGCFFGQGMEICDKELKDLCHVEYLNQSGDWRHYDWCSHDHGEFLKTLPYIGTGFNWIPKKMLESVIVTP